MSEFYKRIPRGLVKNLRWRRFVLRKAKGNKELQQALWNICAREIIFFINSFCWQTNPNADNENETIGPFICWKFQERAILSDDPENPGILWCIDNRKSLVIEKSRFMGATWLVLIVRDWKCRFTRYYDSLMMSKSANAVDDQSRQSLFGKLRFINEHLPRWLHNSDEFLDNKQAFVYPKTQSTQKGFASTGKAGVSERGRDFFIDEYTQIEDDWEVLYRTRATSKCRIFVATHLGEGTAFYALSRNEKFKKIVFHWTQSPMMNKGMYRYGEKQNGDIGIEWLRYNEDTDGLEVVDSPQGYVFPADYDFIKTGEPIGGPHPGVRSPAYDEAFIEMGENLAEMAKDWDINPSGSISQFYTPMRIHQLINQGGRSPLWECECGYDEKTGVPIGLAPTEGGRIKLWCNLDQHGHPPKGVYGVGVDVSGGTNRTASCISIWSAATGENVLEFKDGNIKPEALAVLAKALCTLFCDYDGIGAKIAWENEGPGATFGKTLWQDLGYLRVHCNEGEARFGNKPSNKPGWYPSGPNRLDLHSRYRQALFTHKARNHSRKSLDDCLGFKHDGKGSVEHTQYKDDTDPAGAKQNHGDMVIANALGWKMIEDVVQVPDDVKDAPPRPGTPIWMMKQEELAEQRKGERYTNWNRKRTA